VQQEAGKLRKASEQMDMRPIWEYAKKIRTNNKHAQRPIKKQDGTHTHNTQEEIQRWKEWVKENFHINPEHITPEIMHIEEAEWGK